MDRYKDIQIDRLKNSGIDREIKRWIDKMIDILHINRFQDNNQIE